MTNRNNAASERSVPRDLDYYARDECEESAYIWITAEDRDDTISRIRGASLVTLVDIAGEQILAEAAPGEDVRSILEGEGRGNVELAYGSKYSSNGLNMFRRKELAEEDIDRW